MMNWLYKWLHKKIENVIREEQSTKCSPKYGNDICLTADRDEGIKSINFTMMFAEGGVVFQQRHYDPVKDRHYTKMFLIPEDQDITHRVGEIVAMEMYRV